MPRGSFWALLAADAGLSQFVVDGGPNVISRRESWRSAGADAVIAVHFLNSLDRNPAMDAQLVLTPRELSAFNSLKDSSLHLRVIAAVKLTNDLSLSS
jgi:hypothetical protein